jgi:hypothetical protein
MKKPIDKELLKRLKHVMPHLTKIRARLLLHLFFKKPNTTGEICHSCSIGNLSDMVVKINPLLEKHGLIINNYPPVNPLINSFGEKTMVHYWELVVLDGKDPPPNSLINSDEEKTLVNCWEQVIFDGKKNQ